MNGKKARGANSDGNGAGSPSSTKTEDTSKKSRESKGTSIEDQIILELKRAYEMELETVVNYLANSVHLDGLLAQEVRESLKADIPEELGHATQLAERLKILNADVPGSLSISFSQEQIQPPADTTDVMSVIKGVIDAEKSAIAQYEKIIDLADDADDYVTEDVCIQILGDEQHHLREFEGFRRALEPRGARK